MLRLLVTLCSLSCPALPDPATPPAPPLPLIRAQGVAPTGPAHPIFLSGNNSLVESHRGADARLSCRVRRESDYGTVSIVQCRVYSRPHCTVQISWFRRTGPNSVLVLLTVADDTYVADTRISIVRPVLSMVSSVVLH